MTASEAKERAPLSWRVPATFVALCLIWGIPYFLIKIALVEISPVCIAWTRVALGTAILMPIAWRQGMLGPVLIHKRAICAFAIAELVIPFFMIGMAERWITSSLAGILVSAVPLTVLVLAPLFGVKEKLNARRIAGLAIGFFGVVTLLGFDAAHGLQQWLGVGCTLIAVIGYAIGPLIIQRHLSDVDELGALAGSLLIATVVLLPFAALSAPTQMPSMQALASLAVLGLLCTALAMLLYFYLIRAAGAARASVVAYINPAVAALLGVLVLNEHFGVGSLVGLALIISGSWLATRRYG